MWLLLLLLLLLPQSPFPITHTASTNVHTHARAPQRIHTHSHNHSGTPHQRRLTTYLTISPSTQLLAGWPCSQCHTRYHACALESPVPHRHIRIHIRIHIHVRSSTTLQIPVPLRGSAFRRTAPCRLTTPTLHPVLYDVARPPLILVRLKLPQPRSKAGAMDMAAPRRQTMRPMPPFRSTIEDLCRHHGDYSNHASSVLRSAASDKHFATSKPITQRRRQDNAVPNEAPRWLHPQAVSPLRAQSSRGSGILIHSPIRPCLEALFLVR